MKKIQILGTGCAEQLTANAIRRPAELGLSTSPFIIMETLFVTGIALALLVYLVIAVVRPEKF